MATFKPHSKGRRAPKPKPKEPPLADGPENYRTYSRFGRDPEAYFYVVDRILYGLAREAAADGTGVARRRAARGVFGRTMGKPGAIRSASVGCWRTESGAPHGKPRLT